MTTPRRARALKILLGVVGIVIAVAGGLALWVSAAAARRWEAMEQAVRRIDEEILARPGARPVLTGAAEPGNAWDDYEKALSAVSVFRSSRASFLRNTRLSDPASDAERASLKVTLTSHAGTVDDLHRGTHRAVSKQLPRERRVWTEEDLLALSSLALGRATFFAEEGKLRESAETLLDLAQFARDLDFDVCSSDGEFSRRIWQIAWSALWYLDLGGRLTREDRLSIAGSLERLDSSWGDSRILEDVDVVEIGRLLLQSKDLHELTHSTMAMDGGEASFWVGWRYGFSDRLIAADAFEQLVELSKRISAVRLSALPESQQVQREVLTALEASRNPYLASNYYRFIRGVGRAQERARLRILRTALTYRATGEVLDLEDPLGGRLRHELRGSGLKIWARGADGIDHGGVGQWESSGGKDIVLEVER